MFILVKLHFRLVEMTNPAPDGDSLVTPRALTKLLTTPDFFNGENSWDNWISHFDGVSKVNKWNDQAKLLWLEVRVDGKARKAWSHLSNQEKENCNSAVMALRRRFEPKSKRDLYTAEFQTHGRKLNESWGDVADKLLSLVDKAFPDLDDTAKEKLSLDCYLGLLVLPWPFVNSVQRLLMKQSVPP